MLTLLILLPILGIFGILLNSNIQTTNNISLIEERNKNIALFASIITLLLSIIIYLNWDSSTIGYNNIEEYSINDYKGISFKLGIDGISIYFVLLTTIIIPITLLADRETIKESINTYLIIILLLESIILAIFLVNDLLLFYVTFEATLPPLFLLIGYFGSGNKIRASYYLLLYTLIGSLFLLLTILTISYLANSTNYNVILNTNLSFELQTILWLGMFISFAVKTPLVPFHIWLNLAHSEAPLGGSILLAAIILKLALYGFLRILIPMLPLASMYFVPLVYVICGITIVWASLTTLRQIDVKRVVAYSSIGHVAVSILGAFSNNVIGISGSILFGLAHGFVSPALFIIVGGILYNRYHTRIINYYRGLITYYPLLSLYFFLFTLANCGLPLTINFWGEFLSLAGAFTQNSFIAVIGASSVVLSAAYSVWFWSRISTGTFSPYLSVLPDLTRREFAVLTPLLLLTFFIGFFPNFILNDLEYSVSSLLIS